jgi:hypothetical protein
MIYEALFTLSLLPYVCVDGRDTSHLVRLAGENAEHYFPQSLSSDVYM